MALKRNCNFFFLKKKTRKKEDQQKFWNCRKLRMTSKNLKPVNGKRSGRYPSRRREISSRQWEGEKGVTFIRSKMFYFITRKRCSFCFWILFKHCHRVKISFKKISFDTLWCNCWYKQKNWDLGEEILWEGVG